MFDKLKKLASDIWNGRFEYPEDLYDDSPFWDTMKSVLCADTKFSNILYLFWGDLDCPCCAFIRGVILGSLATFGVSQALF